jgi:hypothetical protein
MPNSSAMSSRRPCASTRPWPPCPWTSALDERRLPPADSPLGPARPVFQGFHLCNVKKTYQELSRR